MAAEGSSPVSRTCHRGAPASALFPASRVFRSRCCARCSRLNGCARPCGAASSPAHTQGPFPGPLISPCFLLPLGFQSLLSSVQTAQRLPNSWDMAVCSQSQNEVHSQSCIQRALLSCWALWHLIPTRGRCDSSPFCR